MRPVSQGLLNSAIVPRTWTSTLCVSVFLFSFIQDLKCLFCRVNSCIDYSQTMLRSYNCSMIEYSHIVVVLLQIHSRVHQQYLRFQAKRRVTCNSIAVP